MIFRYFWFFVGVMVSSFGISLITKAALGTSPISGVPYVLSLALPLSFGQLTFFINMLFIAGQAILLRREFHPIQLLQIGVNLLFSCFIDVSMNVLLCWLNPTDLPSQLASLIVGCAVLGFAINIEVSADVLMIPGDGFVRSIAIKIIRRFGSVRFGTIKVMFDVTLMLIAVALSLLFFGQLNGIGVGTVVSALLVGRFVNLFDDHSPLSAAIKRLRETSAKPQPAPDAARFRKEITPQVCSKTETA